MKHIVRRRTRALERLKKQQINLKVYLGDKPVVSARIAREIAILEERVKPYI
jgi:magnesium-transporting ATPase (P-type)